MIASTFGRRTNVTGFDDAEVALREHETEHLEEEKRDWEGRREAKRKKEMNRRTAVTG